MEWELSLRQATSECMYVWHICCSRMCSFSLDCGATDTANSGAKKLFNTSAKLLTLHFKGSCPCACS